MAAGVVRRYRRLKDNPIIHNNKLFKGVRGDVFDYKGDKLDPLYLSMGLVEEVEIKKRKPRKRVVK